MRLIALAAVALAASACAVGGDYEPPPSSADFLATKAAVERGGLGDPCPDPIALAPGDCAELVSAASASHTGAVPFCLWDGAAATCSFGCSERSEGGFRAPAQRFVDLCAQLGGACVGEVPVCRL